MNKIIMFIPIVGLIKIKCAFKLNFVLYLSYTILHVLSLYYLLYLLLVNVLIY